MSRPVSGVTADTDVNLDFLTKEEKEALLSKKMDIIRQRNKALTERHRLIEADRRKAEEAGQAVQPALESQSLPAEGAMKPRGRGRGQSQNHINNTTNNNNNNNNRPAKERPKSHGDFRDSSNYEPIMDTSDLANYKHEHKGRGRGGGGPRHGDQDRDGPVNTPKNKRRPPPNKEEEPDIESESFNQGGHSGQRHGNRRQDDGRPRYEAKPYRNKNQNNNNSPASAEPSVKAYKGRLKDDEGPPPDPSFNPLADRRRSDNKKEESAEHRRHPRNYGGGADLSRVKQTMKHNREKERERPVSNKPLEMVMTGKERKNHEEWKAEREKYDQERIQRQMNKAGSWKRPWDAEKFGEYEDGYHSSRLEPGKRPAGRIGSGRFDRGERDDRPRSAVIGKGGTLQPGDHAQNQQRQPHQDQHQHHHQQQQQQQQLQSSPHPQPHHSQMGDNKTPKGGKGRGRGRGRGRGSTPVVGEKSPRPRTWSGGDDRFVECQKELLVVKFDNTAGDNSVEVEYEDAEYPGSPPTTPKSGHSNTTPGRGPTGRTPNQAKHDQPRSGKPQQQRNKAPRHRGRPLSGSQQGTSGDEGPASPGAMGYLAGEHRVRSSSHSHSYGDSEEWEDCTESSGAHDDEDNQNLHLECRLNPEAPEFLPTSPDFLKTPPGHVKVLNWASDRSGGSGCTSPLSQGSVTSPKLLSQGSATSPSLNAATPLPAATSSPTSSPGSSVSAKASRRLEEADTMPDGDMPFVPPDFMGAAPPKHEEEEEEEEEQFEDSVEAAPDSKSPADNELQKNNSKAEKDATKPETEDTKPEKEASKAETEATKPEKEASKAETEAIKPEKEAIKPEKEAIKPEKEATKPASPADNIRHSATTPAASTAQDGKDKLPNGDVTPPDTDATTPSAGQEEAAKTPDDKGDIGQGFTDIGQGFTDIGQGFTDIGQGFTDIGQGFTDIGQGFSDTGSVKPKQESESSTSKSQKDLATELGQADISPAIRAEEVSLADEISQASDGPEPSATKHQPANDLASELAEASKGQNLADESPAADLPQSVDTDKQDAPTPGTKDTDTPRENEQLDNKDVVDAKLVPDQLLGSPAQPATPAGGDTNPAVDGTGDQEGSKDNVSAENVAPETVETAAVSNCAQEKEQVSA